MADISRMMEALKNADAAGDTQAATNIAQMIRAAQVAQEPEMGAGTQAARLADLASRGFVESAAETVGSIPELVASGMRKVGLPAPEEGYYPQAIQRGLKYAGETLLSPFTDGLDLGPSGPQSTLESGAYGAGRGVADVASFMAPGAAAAKFAQAGGLPSRIGAAMMTQPVAQTAAGAVAGGVSEATDSEAAGLAAGLALPVGAAGVKRATRGALTPFPSQLSPNEKRLAREAEKAGIGLTAGQQTGSPGLRTMESTYAQLPFTSKVQGEIYEGQRKAFNRAVLGKAGIDADEASPEVMDRAFKSIGREFNDLAEQTLIKVDQQFLDDVATVSNEYGRRLPTDVAPVFKSYIDDLSVLQREMANNPEIAGREYQKLSSAIKKRARSAANNPDLQDALYRLSGTLDDVLERSGGANLKAAWQDVRNRYRNMLTIDKAMGAGSQAEIAAANIPLSGLKTAVKGMDKAGYARGRGDLNRLSRVGGFLGSAIPPDSGTARRSLMQNLMTFGAGGGGAGYMAGGGDPLTAALVAGTALAGPKVTQSIYGTSPIQAYLKNQLALPKQGKLTKDLMAKILLAQQTGQLTESTP
jgi:hypothetical protein